MALVSFRPWGLLVFLLLGLLPLPASATKLSAKEKKIRQQKEKQKRKRKRMLRRLLKKTWLGKTRPIRPQARLSRRTMKYLQRTPAVPKRKKKSLSPRLKTRSLRARPANLRVREPDLKRSAIISKSPRSAKGVRSALTPVGTRLVVYKRRWGRKAWQKRWIGHVLLIQKARGTLEVRLDCPHAEGKRLLVRIVKDFWKVHPTLPEKRAALAWKLRRFLERKHLLEVVQQSFYKRPPRWKHLVSVKRP